MSYSNLSIVIIKHSGGVTKLTLLLASSYLLQCSQKYLFSPLSLDGQTLTVNFSVDKQAYSSLGHLTPSSDE